MHLPDSRQQLLRKCRSWNLSAAEAIIEESDRTVCLNLAPRPLKAAQPSAPRSTSGAGADFTQDTSDRPNHFIEARTHDQKRL
jgi:hypothetical protein